MHRFRKVLFLLLLLSLGAKGSLFAQVATSDTENISTADTSSQVGNTEEPTADTVVSSHIPNNSARPDEQQWEKITSDKAYNYKDQKENAPIKKPEVPQKQPGWVDFLDRFFAFLISAPGQIILWSLFILIIGYIVYRMIRGRGNSFFERTDRKQNQDQPEEESEADLLGQNWDQKFQAALASGDLRLAVRYSYKHTLRLFQERGLILYSPDKTNTAYYFELNEAFRPAFRQLSRFYEFTWYGNLLPEQPQMDAYLSVYEGLKKQFGNS